ncbi:NADH dehydrogenase [ubiquinone] 1 beta subcomplex subunit 8, mitochondrial [Trifolium repens]|nr:NADH dehydrogenase [ubiquinone] 1 beta subcomplex subunit 8, mitochondrial [Trifolium repens]
MRLVRLRCLSEYEQSFHDGPLCTTENNRSLSCNINISENNHRNLTRKKKKKKNLTTIKPHEIMAGRLTYVASQILGGNGVVHRSVASSLRLRSGMGLPVGKHYVPDKPLPMNEELTWDNGTAFPEPCIDRIADTVGKYEALAWLCGGLSCFAGLGLLAVWNDKASKTPFAISSAGKGRKDGGIEGRGLGE